MLTIWPICCGHRRSARGGRARYLFSLRGSPYLLLWHAHRASTARSDKIDDRSHQRLMTVSGEYAIQAPAQRAGLGEQTTIGVPQLVNPRLLNTAALETHDVEPLQPRAISESHPERDNVILDTRQSSYIS